MYEADVPYKNHVWLSSSVLVARRQLCYDRTHFVRFITNDKVCEYDDDSDLPDLESFFDDELDFSDLANNSVSS